MTLSHFSPESESELNRNIQQRSRSHSSKFVWSRNEGHNLRTLSEPEWFFAYTWLRVPVWKILLPGTPLPSPQIIATTLIPSHLYQKSILDSSQGHKHQRSFDSKSKQKFLHKPLGWSTPFSSFSLLNSIFHFHSKCKTLCGILLNYSSLSC